MKKLIYAVIFALACATAKPPPPRPPPIPIPSVPTTGVEAISVKDALAINMVQRDVITESIAAPYFTNAVTAYDKHGKIKWTEYVHNTVTNAGKQQLLDCQFAGTGCVGTWYVMFKHTGAINATDTMASHAGWTEASSFYTGNRLAITWSAASGNSKAASAATSYSVTGTDADVKGACITSTNTGATGTLYSCSDFAAARSVLSGDTITVTPTVTD